MAAAHALLLLAFVTTALGMACSGTTVLTSASGEIVNPMPPGVGTASNDPADRTCIFNVSYGGFNKPEQYLYLTEVWMQLAAGESVQVLNSDGSVLNPGTNGWYLPTLPRFQVIYTNMGNDSGSVALSWAVDPTTAKSTVCTNYDFVVYDLPCGAITPCNSSINTYMPNMTCTWNLTASTAQPVYFQYKMWLGPGDYVRMYSIDAAGALALQMTWSGNMSGILPPLTGDYQFTFSSDALYQGFGYEFIIGNSGGSTCPTTPLGSINTTLPAVGATTYYGDIDFPCPYGTTMYTGGATSTWKVNGGATDFRVGFIIKDFDLAVGDYLEVLEGGSRNDPVIQRWNGGETVNAFNDNQVTRTTTNMLIVLVTQPGSTGKGFRASWALQDPDPGYYSTTDMAQDPIEIYYTPTTPSGDHTALIVMLVVIFVAVGILIGVILYIMVRRAANKRREEKIRATPGGQSLLDDGGKPMADNFSSINNAPAPPQPEGPPPPSVSASEQPRRASVAPPAAAPATVEGEKRGSSSSSSIEV